MRKLFHQIHLWFSVPFGIIVSLLCFSGAMLVFEDEVNEVLHPERYFVSPGNGAPAATPLPIDELMGRVAATLPDSVSVTGVTIPSGADRTWRVSLSKPRRSSLYVDPYTGETRGRGDRSGFFLTMFRLHRWLLDSMKPAGEGIFWGKMVVGTATLMFVFVLISGMVVWWPRTRKMLGNRLRVVASKGWRRFWYDLHAAGGFYTFLLLLIMALTGLTWSFGWYRDAVYAMFGVERIEGGQGGNMGASQPVDKRTSGQGDRTMGKQGNQSTKKSPFAHWQAVYDQLRQSNPQHRQITISRGTASVSTNSYGNLRAADRYTFDFRDGQITETIPYGDQAASGKMRGWLYSVHVGEWGGMLTRVLWFLAALIGTTLPITGYYFWIKKLVKRRGRRKPNPKE
ncbi:MAG: PepSY domain-containing protein [Mediterranea sp.]|jgi:uncharacterized iron-regulated membrane protein|nr:PepSY domain-containing protein [Mediterranea sp.]